LREVVLDITKFGLKVTDVISIKLIDSIGKEHTTADGYSFSKKIVLDSNILTVELRENSTISSLTNYKLTLPSNISFVFKVPYLLEKVPHELSSLFMLSCYKEVFRGINNTSFLADSFLEKLELYFTGENPNFTSTEHDLVKLYEMYADEVVGTTNTIDIAQKIDEYLATIIGEENE